MSYSNVIVKIDSHTKKAAIETAEKLGLTVSDVVKAFLKQFIKTKSMEFSARENEEPSEYLIKTIKQALKDKKEGKASPIFDTGQEMMAWLEKQGV